MSSFVIMFASHKYLEAKLMKRTNYYSDAFAWNVKIGMKYKISFTHYNSKAMLFASSALLKITYYHESTIPKSLVVGKSTWMVLNLTYYCTWTPNLGLKLKLLYRGQDITRIKLFKSHCHRDLNIRRFLSWTKP
jgi:hypothetical protein